MCQATGPLNVVDISGSYKGSSEYLVGAMNCPWTAE